MGDHCKYCGYNYEAEPKAADMWLERAAFFTAGMAVGATMGLWLLSIWG